MKKLLIILGLLCLPLTSYAAVNYGWLYSTGHDNFNHASSSPTFPYLTGTSTATSTLQGGISISSGCFLLPSGSCAGTGGGASLSGGSPNTLTYWISGTTVGATSSPTVDYITATSTSATSSFIGDVQMGSTSPAFLQVNSAAGQFGIGVNGAIGPRALAHIRGSDLPLLLLQNTVGSTNSEAAINFIISNAASPSKTTPMARIEAVRTNRAVSLDTDLRFGTESNSVYAIRAILRDDGNFGLGTSSPGRTLSVNGLSDLGGNASAGTFTATTTAGTSTFAGDVLIATTKHLGVDKTNPLNADVYAGSGTGSLNDAFGSAFTGKVDSTSTQVPSGGRFNLNVINGSANGLALGSVSRVDINDINSTGDAVGLWGDNWVATSSNRNTWGTNTFVDIGSNSAYASTSVGIEAGIFNHILGNFNPGGPIHAVCGTNLEIINEGGCQFGIKISGDTNDAIQVDASTSGPLRNAFYYGTVASGNTPSGTPKFIITGNGGVGIGVTPSVGMLTVSSSTSNLEILAKNPNPIIALNGTDVANKSMGFQMILGDMYFRSYNDAFTASSNLMVLGNNGRLGIGTTTPWRTLSVYGSSDLGNNALAGYFTGTTTSSSTLAGPLGVNSSATPSSPLYVRTDFATYGATNSGIRLDNLGGTAALAALAEISTNEGALRLYNNGTENVRLRTIPTSASYIMTNNFGIGTSSPYSMLSVAGQVVGANYIATTTTASSFPYASSTAITPGVIYDSNASSGASGEVLSSTVTGTDWITNSPTLTGGSPGDLTYWTSTSAIGATSSPSVKYINATSSAVVFYQSGVPLIVSSTTVAGNLSMGYNASSVLDASGSIGNTLFGYESGKTMTTETHNTCFGFRTCAATAGGGSNTFVGYQAGASTTAGTSNVAIGDFALQLNTTGINNMAIGSQSLQLNNGTANVGLGFQTLGNNSSGASNMAIGYTALLTNTTGSYNIGIGDSAVTFNDTGTDNVGIGFQTLGQALESTSSVAIGTKAGYGTTTYQGQGNVFIGYESGFKIGQAANYNTLLGYQSGFNLANGSSNIGIGQNIDFAKKLGSQQLDIGNVLFGSNMYSGTSASNIPVADGSIGVGTSSPGAQFSISRNKNDTKTYIMQVSSTTIANATTTLYQMFYSGMNQWGGTAPTVATGTGAGSFSTANIYKGPLAFTLTVNTGTSPSVNATIATITLPQSCDNKPLIIYSPANKAAAQLGVASSTYATSTAANTFTITSGDVALQASVPYVWSVMAPCI